MTIRRLRVLLVAMVAVAAVIGGLVYSRSRGRLPDDTAAKGEDPPPALVTKVTTPARKLNEKERLLVGTWKFENIAPKLYPPGYQATYEFAPDGTFTFSFSSVYVKHWIQRGSFRITGDIIITEPGTGETAVNLVEELTDSRFVISAQDGRDRSLQEWSRVRRD